jgi:glycerol-3-phosphate dehydrogenase
LLGRYGSCIDDLLELMGRRPGLGQPLGGAGGYLGAEVVYACSHEGAVRLDDVLARRTRIIFETRDRGVAAAAEVAGLMAGELGWDEVRVSHEVSEYREAMAAELAAQSEPSDDLAYAARVKVADPAPFYGDVPGEAAQIRQNDGLRPP